MELGQLGITIGIVIGVLVFVIIAFFVMVTRFYVKAPADRAFVKTGGGKPKVIVNGGDWVIPAFHEVTWVDLRTMDIDIERTEANALLTIDPQYADIRAIFYIKASPLTEDIERAARTIGGGEIRTDTVKRLVESKLEGALRDVAATFTLMSLHQEREKFVERVQTLVRADLAENGLLLETVSITALKSARQGSFGVDDVFGAQVARANAQVIQNALRERNEIDQTTQTEVAKRNATAEQERNEIERNKQLEITRRNSLAGQQQNDIERSAELEIARRNAAVEQEKLTLDRDLAQARATQQREVANKAAEEQSSADQVTHEQRQTAELARVIKEQAIAEAEKAKEQAIQLAEQRKQQAIQLAEQEREREVRRSEVLKQQAIEVADQGRKVALAQQLAELEAAEKKRLEIAAEREAAEQSVFTVQETAAAERESKILIIQAERDAQRELIGRKNQVELEAFKQIKGAEAEAEALNRRAEAEATASIRQAEARRTEAQAETDAAKMRAEAARAAAEAPGLAEAEIIKAKANAALLEADATRARGIAEAESIRARGIAEADGQHAMANALAANEGVAQRLELERIRLQAQIEIGVAQARAMGEAISGMDFKLYGTPDTAQQILRMMSISDGIGGVLQALPAPVREAGARLVDRIAPSTNGSAHAADGGNGNVPLSIDVGAARPLIDEGRAILAALIPEADRKGLSLKTAIERALAQASEPQRASLLKIQGALFVLPGLGDQPLDLVLAMAG